MERKTDKLRETETEIKKEIEEFCLTNLKLPATVCVHLCTDLEKDKDLERERNQERKTQRDRLDKIENASGSVYTFVCRLGKRKTKERKQEKENERERY